MNDIDSTGTTENKEPSNKTIKVAIMGAGSMGKVHGNCLKQIAAVEIVAISSRSRSTAEALATELELEIPCFDNFTAMLDNCEIDAVYINLIPSAHNGEAELAAERGIHVFIEKPIAKDLERAQSMCDAAHSAGIITQVGYHYRFGAAVEHLQNLINDGSAGKATLYQGRFFCNCLHGDWWRDKNHAVAQIFEQVIHQYDMAMHLCGEVSTACGMMSNICHQEIDNYTIEDTSVGSFTFRNGAIGSIVGSNCAVPGQWTGDMRVVFENVTVDFRSANDATFYYPTGEYECREEVIFSEDDLYLKQSLDFINAIQNQGSTRSPISDGFKGIALCTAIIESAAADGRIEKPVTLAHSAAVS